MSTPKPIGTDGPLFKCPICGKIVPNAQAASFPFCSERCRLVDLNKWLDGSYVTSRPIDPTGNDDEIPRRMPPNSSSSSNPADSN